MKTTEEALKQLKATNQIDTLGVTNPGMIIDLHNQLLTKKKEKEFAGQVRDMNQYYIKLMVDTITRRAQGERDPIYKSSSQIFT